MRNVRDDFPLFRRRVDGQGIVYLDSAATSLKPQAVIDAVSRFYTDHTANIHRAVHLLAEEATDTYETARRDLARFINADENEIVFTRGATEAINLVRRCLPQLRSVATTLMEHHSNFLPWLHDCERHLITCDAQGQLDLDALDRSLSAGVDLVSVCQVSNAIGAINPIDEIIRRAHAADALVLVDAAQSITHMPIDVKVLDADFLVCSGHKMLGPGGVGMLFGKSVLLERMGPWLLGGDMIDQVHVDGYTAQQPPYRFEAGTPAIEAVIGWGEAVRYLDALGMAEVEKHSRKLVEYALAKLGEIDHVNLIGPTDAARRCGSVTFNIEDLEAHGVARMLSNRANVMVRSGFHCAQPLHEALDLLPTVRASFHVYNQRAEIDVLADSLEKIVAFI